MALINTLTDNFDDNSIDAAKWDNWGGANVTESSQTLRINSGTAASSYYGIASVANWELTNSSVHVQVVTAGTQAALYGLYPLELSIDANNALYWYINNGTAIAYKLVASTYTAIGAGISHTDGNYYRIRSTSGTTYFEYGTDGSSWTTYNSQANPIAVTSLAVNVFTELTSASTARTAVLDNFNITPSATTGQAKVWNGSAFVAKPVKVWNGSSWVVKPVKRWNGSSWVTTPY